MATLENVNSLSILDFTLKKITKEKHESPAGATVNGHFRRVQVCQIVINMSRLFVIKQRCLFTIILLLNLYRLFLFLKFLSFNGTNRF